MKPPKKTALALLLPFLCAAAFAFDWPQFTLPSMFSNFFGQNQGSTFVSSLVFDEPEAVTATEDGELLVILDDTLQQNGWFPSTLGNTVILEHTNNMFTSYANLTAPAISADTAEVRQGTYLGESSGYGWSSGKRGLEFGVYDTKVQTIINPFILMPQISEERQLEIKNCVAYNRRGEKKEIEEHTRMAAGIYQLYIDRQETGMTYRTTVAVNGAVVETITYNILKQENGRLCFTGNKNYPFAAVYPDETRQFLAEVVFSTGMNSVAVTITDIFGSTATKTFTVEAR